MPYVTPENLTVLRAELHDYLAERVTKPLAALSRIKVLKAVDNYVRRNFSEAKSYVRFRENFDMLKWQLWTAMDRRDLTADELKGRESQREWMREYIRDLPNSRPEIPEWSHEGRLLLLESAVFGNPLSPFFHEPMSAEEFEKFKKRFLDGQKSMSGGNLVSAPAHFFSAAVWVLAESMQKRWPPGFPVDEGLSITNELDFCFQHQLFPRRHFVSQMGDWSTTERVYFDVTGRVVRQPAPFDEKATQRRLAETKEGCLGFDKTTERLFTIHGARLTTVPETDWYELDRIPLAELRRRVDESPLESYSLAALPAEDVSGNPDPRSQAIAKLPTLVLESLEGEVALLRVSESDHGTAYLFSRPRPLPPYPPFHAGDVEYPAMLDARLKTEAAAVAGQAALDRLKELGVWITGYALWPENTAEAARIVRYELHFSDQWKGTDEDWKLLEAIEHPEHLMLHLNTDRLAGLAQVHLAQPLAQVTLLLRSSERLAHVERLPECRRVVLDEENLSPAGYRKLLSLIPDAKKLQLKGLPYGGASVRGGR